MQTYTDLLGLSDIEYSSCSGMPCTALVVGVYVTTWPAEMIEIIQCQTRPYTELGIFAQAEVQVSRYGISNNKSSPCHTRNPDA